MTMHNGDISMRRNVINNLTSFGKGGTFWSPDKE